MAMVRGCEVNDAVEVDVDWWWCMPQLTCSLDPATMGTGASTTSFQVNAPELYSNQNKVSTCGTFWKGLFPMEPLGTQAMSTLAMHA